MIIEFIAILALVAICILLVLDRYFDKEQHQKEINRLLDELARSNRTLVSKNEHDYVMRTAADTVPKDDLPKPDNDLIEPDSLSDDEFDDVLGIKRTPPK